MKMRTAIRVLTFVAFVFSGVIAVQTLTDPARQAGKKCPRGVQPCTEAQVGQPCNPNNLNVLCSKQFNGAYCCLAYAP